MGLLAQTLAMSKRKLETNEDANQPSIAQFFNVKGEKADAEESDNNETLRITYFAEKEEEDDKGERKKKQQKRSSNGDVPSAAKNASKSSRVQQGKKAQIKKTNGSINDPVAKSEGGEKVTSMSPSKSPRQEQSSKRQSRPNSKDAGRKNRKSESSKVTLESIAVLYGEGVQTPRHKPKFREGDRILGVSHISHGELYEAKILKIRPELKQGQPIWQYMLHYQGWAKKWDEWVNEDGLYEDNAESRKLKQEILDRNKALREELKAKGKKQVNAKASSNNESQSNIDHESYEPKEKNYRVR